MQQTAYDGFVRIVDSWFYISIWFILLGLYVFFLSAGPKKTYPAPAWIIKVVHWLKENIHLYHFPTRQGVDGNTVDMDVERSQFAATAIRYEFSMQRAVDEYKEIGDLSKNLTP